MPTCWRPSRVVPFLSKLWLEWSSNTHYLRCDFMTSWHGITWHEYVITKWNVLLFTYFIPRKSHFLTWWPWPLALPIKNLVSAWQMVQPWEWSQIDGWDWKHYLNMGGKKFIFSELYMTHYVPKDTIDLDLQVAKKKMCTCYTPTGEKDIHTILHVTVGHSHGELQKPGWHNTILTFIACSCIKSTWRNTDLVFCVLALNALYLHNVSLKSRT